jgi:hypothetical protein
MRCSENTFDAQLAQACCDLGGPREGLFVPARLRARRPAPEDYRIASSGLAMKGSGLGSANWPRSVGGSAIAASACC